MIVPALQQLVVDLDAAFPDTGKLSDSVTAALARALAQPDWLSSERRRANHDSYARHLIHADAADRYSILAIVWGPGQQSPVHAHHTWCAVGVYSGKLTEILFREASGKPVETHRVERASGSTSFDRPLTAIHRIANTGTGVAISLHVYGVGKDHISTRVNRLYA